MSLQLLPYPCYSLTNFYNFLFHSLKALTSFSSLCVAPQLPTMLVSFCQVWVHGFKGSRIQGLRGLNLQNIMGRNSKKMQKKTTKKGWGAFHMSVSRGPLSHNQWLIMHVCTRRRSSCIYVSLYLQCPGVVRDANLDICCAKPI